MEEIIKVVQQRENIKLMKMSKGFQWEIRVLKNDGETDEQLLARMDKLNKYLEENYGNN